MGVGLHPQQFYDAYIFDLDGTVYLGEALLPTVLETIGQLRQLGRRTVFLSNNPTHLCQTYAEKLTRLGLPTPVEDVINSAVVMARFLQKELPQGRLFVVGEEPLCQVLRSAGFELVEEASQTEAVIASFDRSFSYHKLQVAFDAIRGGSRFFATNGDRFCPVPGGGQPDAAAMIAAIEACTGQQVQAVVGKPSVYMVEAVLELLQMPAQNCLMVGDRLETDVLMGLNANMPAALTLTGATDPIALAQSPIQPNFVIQQLRDLIPV